MRDFRFCRSLVSPAPGEGSAAVAGTARVSLQEVLCRVIQRAVFAGVRSAGFAYLRAREPGVGPVSRGLRFCRWLAARLSAAVPQLRRVRLGWIFREPFPALPGQLHLLESTARGCPWRRLVSAGFDRQAFFAELFRGRACGWRERVGFSLVFPAGLLCGWRWGQRHQGQPCRLHPEEGPGGRRGPRGSFLRLGLCTVIAGWQLLLISRVAPGGLCEVCHPMRWGSLRTVLRGTSGALVRWVEACQGWLAGPDGPEAFSFSS